MSASAPRADFLSELESRQEEALRMLDELDAKILAVLEEFSPKPAIRIATHVEASASAPGGAILSG